MFSQACIILSTVGAGGVARRAMHSAGMHGRGRHVHARDNHLSGRHASYWNAFLLHTVVDAVTVVLPDNNFFHFLST